MHDGRHLRTYPMLVSIAPPEVVRVNIRTSQSETMDEPTSTASHTKDTHVTIQHDTHLRDGHNVDRSVKDKLLGHLLGRFTPLRDSTDSGLEQGVYHMPALVPVLPTLSHDRQASRDHQRDGSCQV